MNRRTFVGALTVLSLAGCGVPFYRNASFPAPRVEEIGMTTWDEGALVVLEITPGSQQLLRLTSAMAFGAAAGASPAALGMVSSGTLFEGNQPSGPSGRFTEAMQAEKPWLAAMIRANLTGEIERRGIKVVPIPMPPDAKEQMLQNQALNYSEAPTSTVLEVRPAWVGYVRSGDVFVPSAEVLVAYFTRKHEIFYSRWFTYGAATGGRATRIAADRKYWFPTEDDLLANIPLAAAGIRAAATPISEIATAVILRPAG